MITKAEQKETAAQGTSRERRTSSRDKTAGRFRRTTSQKAPHKSEDSRNERDAAAGPQRGSGSRERAANVDKPKSSRERAEILDKPKSSKEKATKVVKTSNFKDISSAVADNPSSFFGGVDKRQKKTIYREFSEEPTKAIETVVEEIPEPATELEVVIKVLVSATLLRSLEDLRDSLNADQLFFFRRPPFHIGTA
jgi:hypothetical protein